VPAGGPVAFVNDNIDTYLNLKPATVAQEGEGSSTRVYVAAALAVLGIAVAVVLLPRRGRERPARR
jgi:hypothetical protein